MNESASLDKAYAELIASGKESPRGQEITRARSGECTVPGCPLARGHRGNHLPARAGRKPKVEVMAPPLSELAKQINPGDEPGRYATSPEVDELLLYLDNDAYTYRQVTSIIENLRKKITKGRYNHTLAPKLWTYAADTASQRYLKDGSREDIAFAKRGTGTQAFSAEVRREVGKYLAWRFIRQAQDGEHDK